MGKFKTWFQGLGKGAKIAVIAGASLFGLTALAAATPVPTQSPGPVASVSQNQQASPTPEVKKEEKKSTVEFTTENRDDSSLAKGTTKIVQEGVNGERTITYEVTYIDGKETARKEVLNQVTTQPVTKIIANGTYVAPVQETQTSNGATAKCVDGSLSYSAHRQGTCSHHGGVAVWY